MIDKVSLLSGITGICQTLLQIQIAIMKSFGLVGDPPYNPLKDPFLKYYIATCTWTILLFWIAMKYLDSEIKIITIILIFILLTFLSFSAVIFRKIFLKNYIDDPYSYDRPIGFLHGAYNYWPYFLLIPFTVIVDFFIIIKYSYTIKGNENFYLIFVGYIVTLILLTTARLWWEQVDSSALKEFREKHPAIVEDYIKEITSFRINTK